MGPVPMLALGWTREEGFDAGSFLQQEAVQQGEEEEVPRGAEQAPLPQALHQ